MKHIHIIGIGTGNPEHLTIQAINAMNAADVVFLPVKGVGKEEVRSKNPLKASKKAAAGRG